MEISYSVASIFYHLSFKNIKLYYIKMNNEPILTEEKDRFVILPVKKEYEPLWELYRKHKASFWTPEEIDYSADKEDWDSLNDDERHFIENILAFFAGSDGIVLENLVANFCDDVKISEARAFYAFQGAMETIHSEVYALLIDTYVKDPEKKNKLFNAITHIPSVTAKADWAMKWMDKTQPFSIRLIAFAVVEGILFSGSFASIFWLKSRGKMTRALGTSNEFIARDEGLHTEFAVTLFGYLNSKPDEETVHNIIKEAVAIEKEFICDSISCDMIGMNVALMGQYIEFVADRLSQQLGYEIIYNKKNPFPFMEMLSLDGKSNFFEKRVSEYQMSSVGDEGKFSFDDDLEDF
jgi:ribonucleoside-diphosphate reductase beta chain